jgi:hypothetical protein
MTEAPVRLNEMGEGLVFRTRLTGRDGMVLGFTVDRGVLVEWLGKRVQQYLHPDVLVDPSPSVLVRRGAA